MLDWLIDIDSRAFLALNALHAPYFDSFMTLFTGKFIWVPMYAAVLFVVARNYRWRQAVAVVVCIALAITIADQVCASVIRPVVERLRPANPDNPMSQMVHIVDGYRGGSYGFPSCHAANSFALAAFLAFLFRNIRLTAAIFGWALVNSLSRIYLGVHYPGDLLVGAVIGVVSGLATAWLARYAAKRLGRLVPGKAVNTGVITSVAGLTVMAIAITACFD